GFGPRCNSLPRLKTPARVRLQHGRIRGGRMRQRLLPAAVAVVAMIVAAFAPRSDVHAQTYPDRSVRIIIAFAAGGTIDTLGRIVAQKLGEAWAQSVVVENRPGASGNIGAAGAGGV